MLSLHPNRAKTVIIHFRERRLIIAENTPKYNIICKFAEKIRNSERFNCALGTI